MKRRRNGIEKPKEKCKGYLLVLRISTGLLCQSLDLLIIFCSVIYFIDPLVLNLWIGTYSIRDSIDVIQNRKSDRKVISKDRSFEEYL